MHVRSSTIQGSLLACCAGLSTIIKPSMFIIDRIPLSGRLPLWTPLIYVRSSTTTRPSTYMIDCLPLQCSLLACYVVYYYEAFYVQARLSINLKFSMFILGRLPLWDPLRSYWAIYHYQTIYHYETNSTLYLQTSLNWMGTI